MDKESLLNRIDKIFRANTVDDEVECGQFGQTKTVKVIGDIDELKSDIKDLIKSEFKKGIISKDMVFIGNRKIGASYSVEEAIKVAKVWGYEYVAWNAGTLWTLKGERTEINYDEL
jgi:hypothetical protein